MRLIVLGILALACATTGASGAPEAGAQVRLPHRPPAVLASSRDSAAVVRLERTWLRTSDTTVLGRILAPDFVHIAPGGYVLTRAQHLSWVAAHPRRPDVLRRFGMLRVRVYGDAAIANGVVIASTVKGRVLGRTAFTDVFVKRGGRWRAVNAQEDVVSRRGGAGR